MAPGRSARRSPSERRERRAAVDDVEVVVEAAARMLETRSRSVAEVRRRLTAAGYRLLLVEQALGRLAQLGFLDDETFARAWVESRDRARPRGEHALRRELTQKGVDRALVDSVLAARRGEGEPDTLSQDGTIGGGHLEAIDPDVAAANRLLERRRASLEREPDLRRRRQKAYALLARNGFSPDVSAAASAGLIAGAGEPEGNEASDEGNEAAD